jgi:hypothetical protein
VQRITIGCIRCCGGLLKGNRSFLKGYRVSNDWGEDGSLGGIVSFVTGGWVYIGGVK